MAATATQNPQSKNDSKSSKKKKVAKAVVADTETSSATPEPTPSAAADSTNGDGGYESPYIKELYKSIRNVNKKIANASKVDNVVAANPGLTLSQLVEQRKINADQQAQILKKPALQASLAQLEEQIAQYKKFDQEYKTKTQSEKAEFEKTHTERSSRELEEALASAKAEAQGSEAKALQENLLLLSQFLKLAAIRRAEEEAAELEESKALEGLLAQVYSGDANAVAAMLNLIHGSDETIRSVAGEELSVSFAAIKAASLAQVPATLEEPATETAEYPVESDPTIANAGLTEIDDSPAVMLANGHTEPSEETQGVPQNSGFGDGAANAAAEANWDNNNDLSTSGEWDVVSRDVAETDTGITATPAAPSNVQNWADDQPESPADTTAVAATPTNDGFQEINRNRGGRGHFRGGNRGRGEFRGRGNYRGDGHRGRGGRGGGGNRGGRRPEESAS